MAVTNLSCNVFNFYKTMLHVLSIGFQSSVISLHISRTSTGCLCKQEFSSNYYLLYLNAYMELVLNICRSYYVEERRALALDLLTPSNYTSQERNQGRNEAQQTVCFQFIDPNYGTSFQVLFRTAAALMFLNLDLRHFYARIFFLFEHLTSFKL